MTETPWLTEEEREAWLAFCFTSMLVPSVLDKSLARAAKISLFDYHVLAHLSEGDDRTRTMSELAACTASSLSRLSHVITRFEKQGWVVRSTSAEDGRVTVATLTDSGAALLESIAPRHVQQVRSLLFDALDEDDIEDVTRIGRKVMANIDDDHWFLRPNRK